MAESDSFKVIKALRDGADYFWNSISSLETAIVNVLCTTNDANKDSASNAQQTPKTKISNLENSICNFIEQIFPNPKVERDADNIAQWKRNDLEGGKEDEIKVLVEKTRQNAINLYREISGGSETQQEIKLITLLHANRLKLIKEVLSNDSKSEEDKLEEIEDILKNKGNFNPNLNLMNNIYSLTKVNFQPGNDLKWRSLLPEEPTHAKSPTNSSSIYPPQRRDPSQDRIILDKETPEKSSHAKSTTNSSSIYPPQRRDPSQDRIILDKETKEQLLFRLNDFGYSCLGVIESGFEKSHKIETLQELLREHLQLSKHFTKEHSDLKSDIRKKIESGASVVYLELYKIDSRALKATKSGDETEEKRATFYDSYKQQFLQEKKDSILNNVKDKLMQTKCEVNESIEEEQVETKKVESLLNSKAEIIAESGIKKGIEIMHYSLMGYPTLIDAIRTAMYNEAFIQISFAKGGELVETTRKMTGDDVTPQSSPRNSRSPAPLPSLLEGSSPPPDFDHFIDELDTRKAQEEKSTPAQIREEIEYHEIAQQPTEPPMTAPRRPQKSKEKAPPIIAPTRSL